MKWAFGPVCAMFTVELLACIKNVPLRYHVTVSKDAREELHFWVQAFDSFLHGSRRIWKEAFTVTHKLHTDAAGRGDDGFAGGWAGILVHKGRTHVANGTFVGDACDRNSTWQEVAAVYNCLLSFNRNRQLTGAHLHLFTDSQSSCSILTKGRSKDPAIHQWCVRVLMYAISHDITMHVEWIPREENTLADAFSKAFDPSDWVCCDSVFQSLAHAWGMPQFDLFASASNHKVPRFFSLHHCPECVGINAFTQQWGNLGLCWCYPPFHVIPRVISQAVAQQAIVCLLVPALPGAYWWPGLLASRGLFASFVADVRFFPRTPRSAIVRPGRSNRPGAKTPHWNMIALLIDCRPSDTGARARHLIPVPSHL